MDIKYNKRKSPYLFFKQKKVSCAKCSGAKIHKRFLLETSQMQIYIFIGLLFMCLEYTLKPYGTYLYFQFIRKFTVGHEC